MKNLWARPGRGRAGADYRDGAADMKNPACKAATREREEDWS